VPVEILEFYMKITTLTKLYTSSLIYHGCKSQRPICLVFSLRCPC